MASPMITYAAERKDGLVEKIQQNRVIASLSPLLVRELDPNVVAAFSKNISSAFAGENVDTFDLHQLYTILVTVGWNLNDDVFGVKEVWAARHSPEDKPFNFEHEPRKIIGHITACAAVDDEYKLIPDDIDFDGLPNKFHILTSAVLYKHLKSRDEKLTTETQELIESIARGEWFVSMEALFSDFDYALTAKDGEQHVIARNNDTAHMTKYLRVMGGLGEYQGYKVGRYLKNITFSGKGLVKRPGNPESYIFNDVQMFKGAFASQLNFENNIKQEEATMADTVVNTVAKSDYDAAQKEISDLRTRLEAAKEEKVTEKVKAAEAAVASREEEIKTLKTEIENLKAAKADLVKAHEADKTKLTEAEKNLAEAKKSIEDGKVAAVVANRISTLVEKGVEKAEAEKIVEAFKSDSDEKFAVVVDLHAKAIAAAKPDDEAAKKKKKEDADKKAKADAAALEAAKSDDAALAAASTDDETDTEMVALAAFLGQEVTDKKKKR